jgi:SAM-dependent methyltransferase
VGKNRDDYTAANRAAWDASARFHEEGAEFAKLLDGFAKPGFSCLDAVLSERLEALAVAGKDAAQLCCNNGREILSVKNLGAGRSVGFDQSGAFLEQARRLAAAGKLDCDFVEGDVYKIPADYDGAFDMVLITIGVFGWMPDLGAFFDVIARLMRPGGALLVYEQHPIMNMFEPGAEDPHKPQLLQGRALRGHGRDSLRRHDGRARRAPVLVRAHPRRHHERGTGARPGDRTRPRIPA